MSERQQFERLYKDQAELVAAFLRRRVVGGDADDLLAEVFLAAWRRLDQVPADPLPWLLQIARGLLANRRRGERRTSALLERLRETEGRGSGPSDSPAVDPEVIDALRSLSTSDQELLFMIAWDGLSRRQVAEVLGISAGALAVRLFRARARFARVLADRTHAAESNRVHSQEAY